MKSATLMISLFLVVLSIPSIICGQNGYLKVPGYVDQEIIKQLTKKQTSSYKQIIYQPINDTKASSILINRNRDKTFYWLIKNDSVITSGKIDSSKIFSYRDYLKTGATKKEDKLKFVPPLICGDETENVIYEDDNRKFYFEYGKNTTSYVPDSRLQQYRKEWIELIRRELKNILDN